MKTVGIAAEYNPFHNGHQYHIRETRRQAGEDACVIAVMSGDFVQRGEAAMFSKFARAEAACLCGADLVVELPLPWSLASAERFASGAVDLLASLHVDVISFGSETGTVDDLTELASLLKEKSFTEMVLSELRQNPNQGFAAARQKMAERMLGKDLPLMQQPNNILALEYLKAIQIRKYTMLPIAVKRIGAGHDQRGDSFYPSATELRERMRERNWDCRGIPDPASLIFRTEAERGRIANDSFRLGLIYLSRLRFLEESVFYTLPDSNEDLGRRLYKAIRKSRGYAEIIDITATKRYSKARVRRLCTSAVLGLQKSDFSDIPPYARILAFNDKGKRYIREMSGKTSIPLLIKPSNVKKMSVKAQRCFQIGAEAHETLNLIFRGKNQEEPGEDWRINPCFCN